MISRPCSCRVCASSSLWFEFFCLPMRPQRSIITGITLPLEDRKPCPWTSRPKAKHTCLQLEYTPSPTMWFWLEAVFQFHFLSDCIQHPVISILRVWQKPTLRSVFTSGTCKFSGLIFVVVVLVIYFNCFFTVDLQVRDGAMNCLVEIYRHVGERVRIDLAKKGLPQSRCVQTLTVNI